TSIEKIIGCTGLRILSKLTGLVLAALAAQIVFTGVRHFLA
ncbi:MAG TPA: MarC family protein, partial [Deltaproteobacteria bacterium]|nr:MarC family protein [Deltaproteobacteria bacterium]